MIRVVDARSEFRSTQWYEIDFSKAAQTAIAADAIKSLTGRYPLERKTIYVFKFDPRDIIELPRELFLVWESYDSRNWYLFRKDEYRYEKLPVLSSRAGLKKGPVAQVSGHIVLCPGAVWYAGHGESVGIDKQALLVPRGKIITPRG